MTEILILLIIFWKPVTLGVWYYFIKKDDPQKGVVKLRILNWFDQFSSLVIPGKIY